MRRVITRATATGIPFNGYYPPRSIPKPVNARLTKYNTTTSPPVTYTFDKSGNIIEHITVGRDVNFTIANITVTRTVYFPDDPDITELNDSTTTKTLTWVETLSPRPG